VALGRDPLGQPARHRPRRRPRLRRLAAGGQLDGTEIVDRTALAEAVTEHAYGQDLVLDRPSRFGLG
jgi:hypothetical protein